MGDRYVLGFAPALRFRWSESNSVQTLRKFFGWDYKPRPPPPPPPPPPPSVYACTKMTYARYRSCSPCQSSVGYGNTKITQHALKMPESSAECWSWTLNGRRRRGQWPHGYFRTPTRRFSWLTNTSHATVSVQSRYPTPSKLVMMPHRRQTWAHWSGPHI